jgi:hypothetical protein
MTQSFKNFGELVSPITAMFVVDLGREEKHSQQIKH